ncbi:MAG: hypothetical protein BA066_02885 [Candidatus Korarchaeota archaeon NZ13-K]|nr:MAG: hypothetical protein BA066_02885 [Candidatus Korarchaeota archaeon NZ13-K]
MLRVSAQTCVKCKGGRLLCGLAKCPIIERLKLSVSIPQERIIEGFTPPSSLVSERGYPRILVGPMVSQREIEVPEDPRYWISKDLSYLIARFSSQIYAHFKSHVRKVDDPRIEEMRFSLMSQLPVGMSLELARPPKPRVSFDGVLTPIGPSAPVERLRLTENPKIPGSLERAFYDTDAKVSVIVWESYRRGIDVYPLSKMLSLGGLGERARRKLVPNRWSITAIDSIVGDHLREEVLGFSIYSGDVLLFRSSYEGNDYFILIAPGPYMLEIVEIWMPRGIWTIGSERPVFLVNREFGSSGLEHMDGGHYAMRLAILERLFAMRRQAAVISLRRIGPEYYAPVGVWQVREGVRKALSSEPLRFPELVDAMTYLGRSLNLNMNDLLKLMNLPNLLRRWVSLEGFISGT